MPKKSFKPATNPALQFITHSTQDEQDTHDAQNTSSTQDVHDEHDIQDTSNTHDVHDVHDTQEVAPTPIIKGTQGRKGRKLPRINMAFTPSNLEYLQLIGRIDGVSMTEYVNQLIKTDQGARAATVELAGGILKKRTS